MHLLELTTDAEGLQISDKDKASGIEITGLTSDSRDVRAGYLFAAFSALKFSFFHLLD